MNLPILNRSIVSEPILQPLVQAARDGKIPGFPLPDGYPGVSGWDEDFFIVTAWTRQAVALHKNAAAADFGVTAFDDLANSIKLGSANPLTVPAIFCCGLNRIKSATLSNNPKTPRRGVRSMLKLYALDAPVVISIYAHSTVEVEALRQLAKLIVPDFQCFQTPHILDVLRHPGYIWEQLKSLSARERKSALMGLAGAWWCIILSPLIWYCPWLKLLLPIGFIMIFLGLTGGDGQRYWQYWKH
ncbi:MAG: hypothetical protein LBK60_11375 [Verrucomicrobiales bacterium]|jgi:hypothetical protein|nr:hypothetical protein [Verrucomicrobiales bacterium]